MGIVKKALKIFSPIAMLAGMGSSKPKSAPVASASPATSATADAAAVAAQEEDDKRRRLLALNAGGGNGQLTAPGGDQSAGTTARKTLLGQ